MIVNPILAGVLENQEIDPPPPKSYSGCPNMKNDTSLESSYALLLKSEKNCKLPKIVIYFAKFIFLMKCLQKNVQKMIKYTLLKSS